MSDHDLTPDLKKSLSNGQLVGGELHLGHGPDFTQRSLLELENLTQVIESLVENSRYTDHQSKERVQEALTELRLKSGFSSILVHLRELKRLRAEETIHTIDPEESPRALFHREVRNALKKGDKTLTVYVEMPNLKEREMIVNPPANLLDKLNYYMGAYDEELRLKSAPEIRIRAFDLASPNESGFGIEFN